MKKLPKITLEQLRIFRRSLRPKRKLRFFEVVSLILVIGVLAIFLYWGWWNYVTNPGAISDIERKAPYSKEIKKILKPLKYSGFYTLVRPEVRISLDFDKRTWRLHNIHRFDKEGNVILEKGRCGVCGDLAAYTYSKIQPLFGDQYEISFVRAAESGYFLTPQSSHIILEIVKPSIFGQKEYILDPSFHKYGKKENFEEYLFSEKAMFLSFMALKEKDEIFDIGQLTPILIKKGFLIGLIIDGIDGKFDKDNFILAITATRRFKYAGRYILALRIRNGQEEFFENKSLRVALLNTKEYEQLRERIEFLFSNLR